MVEDPISGASSTSSIVDDEMDQATLVARAQDGDLAAFERLVDDYQDQLFRLALRMVGNRTDAEDIVQDSLIAAWRRLPLIESPGAFGGWVYKIATNRCLDMIRQRATRQTSAVDALAWDAEPARIDSDPERAAERGAQVDALEHLLTTLPPDQRASWLLREIHGRSYAEIAGILGITEGAVRGQIARARVSLAKGMVTWR